MHALTLAERGWFGRQMMPGYIDQPYFSPIFVRKVQPLKSGESLLNVAFRNVAYAEGVHEFEKTLRVLGRWSGVMFAEITREQRGVIVSEITYGWLDTCGLWLGERPRRSDEGTPTAYLDRIFPGFLMSVLRRNGSAEHVRLEVQPTPSQ